LGIAIGLSSDVASPTRKKVCFKLNKQTISFKSLKVWEMQLGCHVMLLPRQENEFMDGLFANE
jgi:hypothetical protein